MLKGFSNGDVERDEIKAIIALGMLAIFVALFQFWAKNAQGLLSNLGLNYQNNSVTWFLNGNIVITIISFSVYLGFLSLYYSIPVGKLTRCTNLLRKVMNFSFIIASISIIPIGVMEIIRIFGSIA